MQTILLLNNLQTGREPRLCASSGELALPVIASVLKRLLAGSCADGPFSSCVHPDVAAATPPHDLEFYRRAAHDYLQLAEMAAAASSSSVGSGPSGALAGQYYLLDLFWFLRAADSGSPSQSESGSPLQVAASSAQPVTELQLPSGSLGSTSVRFTPPNIRVSGSRMWQCGLAGHLAYLLAVADALNLAYCTVVTELASTRFYYLHGNLPVNALEQQGKQLLQTLLRVWLLLRRLHDARSLVNNLARELDPDPSHRFTEGALRELIQNQWGRLRQDQEQRFQIASSRFLYHPGNLVSRTGSSSMRVPSDDSSRRPSALDAPSDGNGHGSAEPSGSQQPVISDSDGSAAAPSVPLSQIAVDLSQMVAAPQLDDPFARPGMFRALVKSTDFAGNVDHASQLEYFVYLLQCAMWMLRHPGISREAEASPSAGVSLAPQASASSSQSADPEATALFGLNPASAQELEIPMSYVFMPLIVASIHAADPAFFSPAVRGHLFHHWDVALLRAWNEGLWDRWIAALSHHIVTGVQGPRTTTVASNCRWHPSSACSGSCGSACRRPPRWIH